MGLTAGKKELSAIGDLQADAEVLGDLPHKALEGGLPDEWVNR